MSVRPLKDNVIIERQEKEQVTSGGIVLPGGDREVADKATVIAIGPEVSDINEGDVVLVNWNKASKIDEKIYKISFEDVIGIFE
jgi:co-chaperonin GroES (HSP10)